MSRRTALVGLGGAVLGASAAAIGTATADAASTPGPHTPLPYFGGFASAIRPDLSRPSCASSRIVWRGDGSDRAIALTFDDGPRPLWTPLVLEALAAEDVPATFFVKGINVRDHGQIHLGSIGRHEFGNHTWNHPDLAKLDATACADQLARCSEQIHAAYGVAPTLFRPPYGHLGGAAVLAAAQAGLTTVLWSTSFKDSMFDRTPSGTAVHLGALFSPGDVVLSHDTGPSARLLQIQALRTVIRQFRADGYTFRTVTDLLAGRQALPVARAT